MSQPGEAGQLEGFGGTSLVVRARWSFRAPSGLETRGLHALAREKAIDGLAMNAQNAADAHGVETPVVNQAPDRLRVDTQLVRDLTHADETRISTC
jgi:hypothetical protein